MMGVRLQSWGAAIALATAAALIPANIRAQEGLIQPPERKIIFSTPTTPLNQPEIPEVVDVLGRSNTFWFEQTGGGDALWLFGFELENFYRENVLARVGRRVEALYNDLLQQQSQNDPLIRTRDLETPYNTSLQQLNLPALDTNRFGFPPPSLP